MPRKPPPAGVARIASNLCYQDSVAALDFLVRAFGFELRLKVEADDGTIAYSELVYGDGVISVSQVDSGSNGKSPRSLGGANTQFLAILVDDVDAHCSVARAAGATIVDPPTTRDHGERYTVDRTYRADDLEGHRWAFWQRLQDRR